MTLRLGKRPHVPSPHDLHFAAVVDTAVVLPQIPKTFGHETGFAYAMLGNGPDDTVAPGFQGAGDCVFAGACEETHLVEHAAGRTLARLTGKEAIAAYSAVTGYVIGDDATDQGTDVRTALSWRRKTGLRDASGKRHKIGAYLKLDTSNLQEIMAALYVFGAVGIGFAFPEYAMTQFDQGKPWSYIPGQPAPVGGHYVPLVARRKATSIDVLSWARLQVMTLSFFKHYVDEAWAIVPTEYLNPASGKSPEGFDQAGLNALLSAL